MRGPMKYMFAYRRNLLKLNYIYTNTSGSHLHTKNIVITEETIIMLEGKEDRILQ